MNLSVGIVGLPNVGKSTLFNALLKKQQALAANYPFATIEPNVGVVPVPDVRLTKLAEITKEEDKISNLPPIKSATVNFVDIAGLVKGASVGAGLGNKFLSHIREVIIVAHVVRAFADENVIREGSIDPKSDYETIETELMLADLQTVTNVQSRLKRFADVNEKNAIDKLAKGLADGKAVRSISFTDEERIYVQQLFFLSAKPEIIVLNVAESQYNPEGIKKVIDEYTELFASVTARSPQATAAVSLNQIASSSSTSRNDNMVVICAKIESELAELSEEEQKDYLKDLGLTASGLERLIQKAYEQLGLISFLTAGEKEVKAWTIKKGFNAVEAAGEIHTDFMKKFIKAEVVSYDDYVQVPGRKKAREVGKARLEGKDYIVKDGDVIEFKIGN